MILFTNLHQTGQARLDSISTKFSKFSPKAIVLLFTLKFILCFDANPIFATSPLSMRTTIPVAIEADSLSPKGLTDDRYTFKDARDYVANLTEEDFKKFSYLQVVASRNHAAAKQYVKLFSNFMPTLLCQIERDDLPYRVVIGPFEDWAAAMYFKKENLGIVPRDAFVKSAYEVEKMTIERYEPLVKR